MKILKIMAIALLLFATSCAGRSLSNFEGTEPELILEEYFVGKTRGYGMVFDRAGTLKRRFVVDIVGKYEGPFLTLSENFSFDDGERSQKTWRIEKLGDKSYSGTQDDVVGTAAANANGSAINWKYVMKVKAEDKEYEIDFDDWMFQHSDGIVINTITMEKFGFKVGEIKMVFMKP